MEIPRITAAGGRRNRVKAAVAELSTKKTAGAVVTYFVATTAKESFAGARVNKGGARPEVASRAGNRLELSAVTRSTARQSVSKRNIASDVVLLEILERDVTNADD